MSTDLLAVFHRLASSPIALDRLRQWILGLAVRGRLVPQVDSDEPVSDLLDRVDAESSLGPRYGTSSRPAVRLSYVGTLHRIPDTWSWVPLGRIAEVVMGQSPPGTTYNKVGDGLPLINGPVEFTGGPFGETIVNQYTSAPTNVCKRGDLLLCVRGSTTGRTNIAAFDACIGRGVAAIRPRQDYGYLRLVVWHQRAAIIASGRGVAFPSISRDQVRGLPVPLPPLPEQRRIVARIDELMALCDELDFAQTERETRRDHARTTTLRGLVSADQWKDSARIFVHHSPRMITKPEHVADVRRAILHLAVMGRLLPQMPEDESAPVLLNRIKSSQTLGKVIPPSNSNSVERSSDGTPVGWTHAQMGEVFRVTGGIQKQPSRRPHNNAFPYLGVSNVQRGRLVLDKVAKFELFPGELDKLRLEPGDLLVVEGNGSPNEIGRCARWNGEIADCVHQNHIIRCRPLHPTLERFTLLYLNSPPGAAAMRDLAITSAGLYSLSVGKIQRITIPMPPLAEQHRIVAKVGELMAVCDELEAALLVMRNDRSRSLEGLLNESLSGAGDSSALDS